MTASRRRLAVLLAGAALIVAAPASVVRYVPEGDLGVVRSPGTVRHVPPGFLLINPLRDRFDRIPGERQEIHGIASFRTADGFTARVPFTARVTLDARRFDLALGDRRGQEARDGARGALAAGLALWGAQHQAVELLTSDLGAEAEAAARVAGPEIGMFVHELRLEPPDPDLYLLLAEDALTRRDAAGRIGLVDAALARSPDDATLLAARGLLHEAAGDPAAAEPFYLRAVQVDPGDEDALARLFVRCQADGRLFQLEDLLRRGLDANPDSVRIRNWLALTFVPLGRHAEAIEQLERARDLAPRDEATLTNLGGVLQRAGRLDEAAEAHRLALAASPGDARLLLNVGLVEAARGDLPAARRALEAALAAGASSVQLHNALAEVYRLSDMKEEAVGQLQASFALDPEQPGLREVLTRLLGRPPG
jgi:tetratricopeptide (TPR) repeat protein